MSPPRLKAGVVWINATNLFDAAAGFGGYRESGLGARAAAKASTNIWSLDGAKAKGREAAKLRAHRRTVADGADRRSRRGRPHGKTLYRRQAGAA